MYVWFHWRTLDKVSIPYENAHRFSLYSDRPHQVPSCHQVVGDFTTLLRSPGDFTKIQCLGASSCGLWLVEGWVHAESSFTPPHASRFCHFRNQSSNSFWVPLESFCWESSKTFVVSFSAWRISQSVIIIRSSKHQSIMLIEEILHQLTWRISEYLICHRVS